MNWIAPPNVALIVVDVQNAFCSWGNLPIQGGEEVVEPCNDLQLSFGPKRTIYTKDWHPPDNASFHTRHDGRKPFDQIWMKDGREVPVGTAGAIRQTLWTPHAIAGTQDAEFHPDLMLWPDRRELHKGTNRDIDSYSGFYENDGIAIPRFNDGRGLAETLRSERIDTNVFAGLAGSHCVGWNGLDSKHDGFRTIVAWYATRSIDIPAEDEMGNPVPGMNAEQYMLKRLRDAGVEVVYSKDELIHALSNGPGHNPQPVF